MKVWIFSRLVSLCIAGILFIIFMTFHMFVIRSSNSLEVILRADDLTTVKLQDEDNGLLLNSVIEGSGSQLLFHNLSASMHCFDKDTSFREGRREHYWVLYNYIRAEKRYRNLKLISYIMIIDIMIKHSCHESVTYSTHGGFVFLDNLEPILERWQGPLSVSIHAPGTDFEKAVESILYYRHCTNSSMVRDFTTFHLIFDLEHIPEVIPTQEQLASKVPNCSYPTHWDNFTTYKAGKNLTYPVNIARNVARSTAATHFVYPSDIELYPSPDLIPNFLDMIRRDETPPGSEGNRRRVYVNNIFEIHKNVTLPQNKAELVQLLKENKVIPFHKYLCSHCHKIPKDQEWLKDPVQPGMRVFHVAKRTEPFGKWEPIYIGTNEEPEYDERLSWEGRSDKMVQAYKLCLMDYEFHILDNSFLLHSPGIKRIGDIKSLLYSPNVSKQGYLIGKKIRPEVERIYGTRPGCRL